VAVVGHDTDGRMIAGIADSAAIAFMGVSDGKDSGIERGRGA
jgi:hypothetical protein